MRPAYGIFPPAHMMQAAYCERAAAMVRDINPPYCPAQKGSGTDIIAAGFTLIVREARQDVGGDAATTQISGCFSAGGQSGDRAVPGDALVTAVLNVPAASLPAALARRVSASPALLARAEDHLRRAVTVCRCRPGRDCPALNAASLLAALEHAIGDRHPPCAAGRSEGR
jgi:hypothetical protein